MLLKNSLKKIKKSFGRYLSLVLIILLGVGFYTGIIVSVPNIRDVQTEYYNEKYVIIVEVDITKEFSTNSENNNYSTNNGCIRLYNASSRRGKIFIIKRRYVN